MKFLDSFLEEVSGIEKDAFCSFYNCPFFLSKTIEETKEKATEEEMDDFGNTEILNGISPLKFETDKVKVEELLSLQDGTEEVWVIPLQKKNADPLSKQMITIGRTMNNDISLPFKGISKFHSYLLVEGMETHLVDGGSTNGTYLNGKQIPPLEKFLLKNMDTVSFARIFHYFYFTPQRLFDYLQFKKLI